MGRDLYDWPAQRVIFDRGDAIIGFFLFFFNDTATTEIYTLSLHDALPIFLRRQEGVLDQLLGERAAARQVRLVAEDIAEYRAGNADRIDARVIVEAAILDRQRSEEHTSELQSLAYLVCRLLLEKKKKE